MNQFVSDLIQFLKNCEHCYSYSGIQEKTGFPEERLKMLEEWALGDHLIEKIPDLGYILTKRGQWFMKHPDKY